MRIYILILVSLTATFAQVQSDKCNVSFVHVQNYTYIGSTNGVNVIYEDNTGWIT